MRKTYLLAATVMLCIAAGCGNSDTESVPTITPVPTEAVMPDTESTEEPTDVPTEAEEACTLDFSQYTGVYGEEFELTMGAGKNFGQLRGGRNQSGSGKHLCQL